jgi:hypothetical protein
MTLYDATQLAPLVPFEPELLVAARPRKWFLETLGPKALTLGRKSLFPRCPASLDLDRNVGRRCPSTKTRIGSLVFSLRILKESPVEGAIKAPATSSIFRWRIIGSVALKLDLAESQ